MPLLAPTLQSFGHDFQVKLIPNIKSFQKPELMAEGSEASSSRLLILECPWVRIQPQTWQIFFLSIFFFCADFFNFFSFRDKKGTFINHVDPYLGVLDAKYQLYRNFSTRIYIDSLQWAATHIWNDSAFLNFSSIHDGKFWKLKY